MINSNKQLFHIQINQPEIVSDQFSYVLPKVENRKISERQINIRFHGNSTWLTQVYLNGSDILSEILASEDHQFTIKRLNSFENGPVNITVIIDGNNLTLTPVIYGIV